MKETRRTMYKTGLHVEPPLPFLTGKRQPNHFGVLILPVVAFLMGSVFLSVAGTVIRVISVHQLRYNNPGMFLQLVFWLLLGGYLIVRSLQGFVQWFKRKEKNAT